MAETLKQLRVRATEIHQAGKLSQAAPLYAAYLAQVPTDARMWSNLGVLHRAAGRHKQAKRAQVRAYTLDPEDVGTRNNYANILSDIGDYDASISLRRSLLDADPNSIIQLAMIGRCLRGKGDYHAAIAHLKTAVAAHPQEAELKMQLAFAELGAGAYKPAFENYKARWNAGELKPRDLPYPQWAGEDLMGKTILVMPEQGFGDAVLFARFIPILKDLGATVHVLVEKPLLALFLGLEGADWTGPAVGPENGVDYYVNMMDVAAHYFQTKRKIPAPAKLSIPETSTERARAITAPYRAKFKVGVIWTGSVTYKGNAFRSFSHTDYLPLTDIENVQLFSLYKGPMLEPYFADGSSGFIVDAGSTERGFADTAATMQEMDLVITSDTATAHIAGSLGIPTWIILHWDAFWVWRHSGATTDWYPNARLFRQDRPLDWVGVHSLVKDALIDHVKDLQ